MKKILSIQNNIFPNIIQQAFKLFFSKTNTLIIVSILLYSFAYAGPIDLSGMGGCSSSGKIYVSNVNVYLDQINSYNSNFPDRRNQIVYDNATFEEAQINYEIISSIIEYAKINGCEVIFNDRSGTFIDIFPNPEENIFLHAIPTGEQELPYGTKVRRYVMPIFDLTGFGNIIDGGKKILRVNGLALMKKFYNDLDAIKGICVSDLGKEKCGKPSMKDLCDIYGDKNPKELQADPAYKNALTAFMTCPICIDDDCREGGISLPNDVLEAFEVENRARGNLGQSPLSLAEFLTEKFWYSVFYSDGCAPQATKPISKTSLSIRNFSIRTGTSFLIFDKPILFGDCAAQADKAKCDKPIEDYYTTCGFDRSDLPVHRPEVLNGVFIESCCRDIPNYTSCDLNRARREATFYNVDMTNLSNGLRIERSKGVVSVYCDLSGFTDTGYSVESSENCHLLKSSVGGGLDGNCSIRSQNDHCGVFCTNVYSNERSEQLVSIENSCNTHVNGNNIYGRTGSTGAIYSDSGILSKGIDCKRVSGLWAEGNKINAVRLGISVRSGDQGYGLGGSQGPSEDVFLNGNSIDTGSGAGVSGCQYNHAAFEVINAKNIRITNSECYLHNIAPFVFFRQSSSSRLESISISGCKVYNPCKNYIYANIPHMGGVPQRDCSDVRVHGGLTISNTDFIINQCHANPYPDEFYYCDEVDHRNYGIDLREDLFVPTQIKDIRFFNFSTSTPRIAVLDLPYVNVTNISGGEVLKTYWENPEQIPMVFTGDAPNCGNVDCSSAMPSNSNRYLQQNIGQEKGLITPNPASTEIDIQIPFAQKSIVQIIDVTGKVIYDKILLDKENLNVNIDNLANGLYFVLIQSGNEILNTKFIKAAQK